MKKCPLADFGRFEITREDMLSNIASAVKRAKEREKSSSHPFSKSKNVKNHYNVCEKSLLAKTICKYI